MKQWPLALPWTVSLAAHALLLVAGTGWLAQRSRLEPAIAELVVQLPASVKRMPVVAVPPDSTRIDAPTARARPQPSLAGGLPAARSRLPREIPQPASVAPAAAPASPPGPASTGVEPPVPVTVVASGERMLVPEPGAPASVPVPMRVGLEAPTPARADGDALTGGNAGAAHAVPPLAGEGYGLLPAVSVDAPTPDYPDSARRRGVEGLVRLRARIDAEGHADAIRLLASSGSKTLDAAALEGVARWRFRPARRGDQAVPSWLDIPVRFALRSDVDRSR